MKLLNIDNNAKTVKGQKKGYMTAVMYLAPANLSGFEVCPMATNGCRAACLNTAGRGAFSTIQASRIAKTRFFFEQREVFMAQLVKEITAFIKHAKALDFIPTVRLNGTSDIPWERIKCGLYPNIMAAFPSTLIWYDYSKRSNRKNLPANYSLTFSLAEDNEDFAREALSNGHNVAVVFGGKKGEHLPETYLDTQVINGDENDLRFLDPKGVIVGLYAKGKAKKDTSGFVKYPFLEAAIYGDNALETEF